MTAFELDTQFGRESVRVQRATRLPGVEFWSLLETERRRTLVSDAFCASLVVAAGGPHGRVRTWARGVEHELSPHHVLLSEPGEVQHLGGASTPCTVFVVRWPRATLEAAAADQGLPGGFQWRAPFLGPGVHSDHMLDLFALLSAGAAADRVVAAYEGVTGALLDAGAAEGFPRRPRGGHPTIWRALDRMKGGLSDWSSLEALATESGLSKFHFSRSFRRTMGLAPHQYRRHLRLEAARRLLESGLSVTETAQRLSFSDASHLIRSFRESLGVAPGLWAKAWRASDPGSERTPETIPPPYSLAQR